MDTKTYRGVRYRIMPLVLALLNHTLSTKALDPSATEPRFTRSEPTNDHSEELNPKSVLHASPEKSPQGAEPSPDYIAFSFNKKPLVDILNELAEKKKFLLILPQTAPDLDAIKKQIITYNPYGRVHIPLKDAWNLTITFLELSGFSLVHKKENIYAVVRNSVIDGGSITRDILPLYIEASPPPTNQRIRYIFFLSNLKVPAIQEKETHPLFKMLKELLSKDALITFDPRTNRVIITDKAEQIASVINIVKELDLRGFKEEVAFVPLTHVHVNDVVKIFDSLKKASGTTDARGFIRSDPQTDSLSNFTQDTRITGDRHRNGVFIMGKSANVDRISEFIANKLDVAPEQGQSILHHYSLQYLDAQTFAPVLQKIVSSFVSGPQATQAPVRHGQEHFLKGVQIVAQTLLEAEQRITTEEVLLEAQKEFAEIKGIEGKLKLGGNRLIIAARQDDWNFVEQLIKKLDKPQYQVILEILIVDFTYDVTNQIAGAIRSKTDSLLPNGVEFLSSHITDVNTLLGNTPTQLAEDLLQVVGPNSVANTVSPGSLLISLNDPKTPGIFGLLQILNRVLQAKVRSYPYLIVTNHQKGMVEAEELRRSQGDLITTTDGTYTIPIVDVPAAIKVIATPHVLSDDRLRLDIGFSIDEFVGKTFTRLTRGLKTTATLTAGQILAMGGIIRTERTEFATQTPFFGNIPIFGAFFRRRNARTVRTNITLFVTPIIIEPRSRQLLAKKNRDKICDTMEDTNDIYDERDPISYLFLKEPTPTMANDFFANTSNMTDFKMESCNAEPIKLFRAPPALTPPPSRPLKMDKLKELLAHENNPFLGIKNRKG